MSKIIRIALLAGGWSREHDVSMKSGDAVFEALVENGYAVERIDPLYNLDVLIRHKEEFDVVFSVLHGRFGEDGCVQGLLEILKIPFVGSGVLGSALSMNKKVAKELYRLGGLTVARDVCLKKGETVDIPSAVKRVGLPLFVKPVGEGSSLGMSLCRSVDEVERGVELGFAHDREVMLEEYIEGREVTGCVIGGSVLEALPLIEIVPRSGNGFFDYDAKYIPGAAQEICPAPLRETEEAMLSSAAKAAHRILRCSVWSRTDMILKGEQVYVLETNTLPGMTRNSLFPLAAKTAGMSLGELVRRLVEISLESADTR